MHDTPIRAPTVASAPLQTARPGTCAGLAEASRRHYSLTALRSIVATWDERMRFRRELQRKLKDDPYLIADIGLTRRQCEAEIAKPFWRR